MPDHRQNNGAPRGMQIPVCDSKCAFFIFHFLCSTSNKKRSLTTENGQKHTEVLFWPFFVLSERFLFEVEHKNKMEKAHLLSHTGTSPHQSVNGGGTSPREIAESRSGASPSTRSRDQNNYDFYASGGTGMREVFTPVLVSSDVKQNDKLVIKNIAH